MNVERTRNCQMVLRLNEKDYGKLKHILEKENKKQLDWINEIFDEKKQISIVHYKKEISILKKYEQQIKQNLKPILYGTENDFFENVELKKETIEELFDKLYIEIESSISQKEEFNNLKNQIENRQPKNKKINIRLTEDEKERVENFIKEKGLKSKDDLISCVINDFPITNFEEYNCMIELILTIKKDINKIKSRLNLMRKKFEKQKFLGVDCMIKKIDHEIEKVTIKVS